MRKLGVDYGDARIGLALTDLLCVISSPFAVYERKSPEADVGYLAELIGAQSVDTAVIGLPVNMDGSLGDRAEAVKAFGAELHKALSARNIKADIVYMDERLTTAACEKFLISSGVRREKRKDVIDKLAAQMILQAYLDNPFGIIS